MSRKSQTHRDNLPILGSETSFDKKKAKSSLNIAVKTPEKNSAHSSSNNETQCNATNSKNTTRNLHFSFGNSKETTTKKNYIKNSDKYIKPPEKSQKPPKISMIPTRRATSLVRTATVIKTDKESKTPMTLSASKRSLTFDSLNTKPKTTTGATTTTTAATLLTPNITKAPQYMRVDYKSIEDLEKRLECLQTIFMNKLILLKSREPEKVKKSYKFVALLVDDEAKLIVKDSDAKRLPNSIPAKSLEDLHLKIGKFFTGCLLAFTDKLRAYQREKRSINCDDIYKDMKNEEKYFCSTLKEWVQELCCDEADVTLIPNSELTIEECAVTSTSKQLCEFGMQTDLELVEHFGKPSNEFADLVNLHVELNELKQQLSKKDENYLSQIIKIKDQFELKNNELKNSLFREQNIVTAKEEEISKLQKENEDLSQQLEETLKQLGALNKQNDELNAKLKNEMDLGQELTKIRAEFQTLCQEKNELLEIKTNFLRKLNQRSTRIDTLEKEVKQQKNKLELQTKEIEDLKKEFEAKVKENREYKDSLDARNQLIDHLRKAVEIEQRKRKEYEAEFEADKKVLINKTNEEQQHLNHLGVKFANLLPILDTKHTNKKSENLKRSYEQFQTHKDSRNIGKEKSNRNTTKEPIVVEENPFMLNIPKEDSDELSSEEIIAVKDRFLNAKRKSRTIVVKKYEV